LGLSAERRTAPERLASEQLPVAILNGDEKMVQEDGTGKPGRVGAARLSK